MRVDADIGRAENLMGFAHVFGRHRRGQWLLVAARHRKGELGHCVGS